MFLGARIVCAGLITRYSAAHLAAPSRWERGEGDFVRQGEGFWRAARGVGQAPGSGLLSHPPQAARPMEPRPAVKRAKDCQNTFAEPSSEKGESHRIHRILSASNLERLSRSDPAGLSPSSTPSMEWLASWASVSPSVSWE